MRQWKVSGVTIYDRKFETYEALVTSIKEYIAFYNHKRYQTKSGSLAPAEYRTLAVIWFYNFKY